MRNFIIAVLLALLAWFGAAIIRLENARYASSLGMCDHAVIGDRERCLEETETRTSWLWNLLYGLRVI